MGFGRRLQRCGCGSAGGFGTGLRAGEAGGGVELVGPFFGQEGLGARGFRLRRGSVGAGFAFGR